VNINREYIRIFINIFFRVIYINFIDFEFGAHYTPNLTWSHYRLIMRLTGRNAIKYYLL
jgi:hypothetical protein